MHFWRPLHRGLRALVSRWRDVDDEVASYAAEAAASGAKVDDLERVRDHVRASGWEHHLDAAWCDLRQAGRRLAHTPGFTIAAVVVLALGIGAGAAMYSVLDAVLLAPLPYAQPQRLLRLELPDSYSFGGSVSLPNVRAWRQRASDFSAIAFAYTGRTTLEQPGGTSFIANLEVSANLLPTLGVHPVLGRGFTRADAHTPVAVLTNTLWQLAFHGRSDIVGRQIELDGKGYTVIGVLPSGVSFPMGDTTLMTPFVPKPGQEDWGSGANLDVIGRLRDAVEPAVAQAQLNGIQAALAHEHPDLRGLPSQAVARDYRQELAGPILPALHALTAATGLVWLIACLSVAGLLLTRFAGQRHELAVRAALGAGRGRLLRQLLAECVLLAAAGALAGWGLAAGGTTLLGHYTMTRLPLGRNQIRASGQALWGLMGLSALSVMMIGLLPAWLASSAPAQAGLRESGNAASPSRAASRLRSGLVISEVALALLLLTGASLLLRTLYNLRSIPLGFSTRNIITTPLRFLPGSFAHRDVVAAFDRPLLERVHALPGVEAASLTTTIPLERGITINMSFDQSGATPAMKASFRITSPEFTKVFGISTLQGRFFNAGDTVHTPEVVVVNQAFANKYFPGQKIVGRTLGHKNPVEIIGVLANVHGHAPGIAPEPEVYFSTTQMGPARRRYYSIVSQFNDLAVRTSASASAAIPELRRLLHQIAPEVAGTNFQTMRQLVNDSLAGQIFAARLLTLFGLAALAIALAGLYGLLAYAVTVRRRELGIRMALGAERHQVANLVLRQAAGLLALGIAAGLLLSWELAHLLASYLYGVRPRDAASLGAASVLLALCGLWAAWVPARRAAGIEPTEALRAE